MTPEENRKKIHTLAVLLLFPFFMIAMAGAVYWMNVQGITLFGSESRARGELLASPYVSLADFAGLQVIRGEAPIREAGERSWSFLQVMPSRCDDICKQQLWESRQTRLALGRLTTRVRRAIIVLDDAPDDAFSAFIEQEHPDASVWLVPKAEWDRLMGHDEQPVKLYFADRFGYIMMRYRNAHTYKDITKDMSFLIRNN